MDIATSALEITQITFAFLGTLLIGVPIWLKLGRHWTLLVTIPLATILTILVKNELPLVTGFTPEVIISVVVAHIAMTGVIAQLIYADTKARLRKELDKRKSST